LLAYCDLSDEGDVSDASDDGDVGQMRFFGVPTSITYITS
jgi:hypothetical protein